MEDGRDARLGTGTWSDGEVSGLSLHFTSTFCLSRACSMTAAILEQKTGYIPEKPEELCSITVMARMVPHNPVTEVTLDQMWGHHTLPLAVGELKFPGPSGPKAYINHGFPRSLGLLLDSGLSINRLS